MIVPEYFGVICAKFSLAVVLAGVLGIEREFRGRSAGLRTHVLVCLGATLSVALFDLVLTRVADSERAAIEAARIAAGIITGVGFLGAGTIINLGSIHKGLTTAAMIWFVAALGICIGLGYYLVALSATAFALFTVVGLEFISRRIHSYEGFSLSIRMPHGLHEIAAVENSIRDQGFQIMSSKVEVSFEDDHVVLDLELFGKRGTDFAGRIDLLIKMVEERFESIQRISYQR